MKVHEKTDIRYQCEYCLNYYYDETKALDCEKSHTPVYVGDIITYYKRETESDWGRDYPVTNEYSGRIVKKGTRDNYKRLLVENVEGEREWIDEWHYYRGKRY